MVNDNPLNFWLPRMANANKTKNSIRGIPVFAAFPSTIMTIVIDRHKSAQINNNLNIGFI